MSGNETSNINLVPRPAELFARTVCMTMADQVCPKSVSLPSLKAKPREPLSSERKNTDRPRSAPSSPNAGRRLLTARSKTKQRKLRHARKQQTAKQKHTASLKQRHDSTAIVATPSYTLYRSPSSVQMSINTTSFFGTAEDDEAAHGRKEQAPQSNRKVTLPSMTTSAATQRTMEQIQESMRIQETLQREIADMNLRMEQQNEYHQEHIEELQEEFDKERQRLGQSHNMDMSNLKATHQQEQQIIQDKHCEELQELRSEMASESSRLQGELDFTRELLQSTKVELGTEAEETLQRREEELTSLHKQELEQLQSSLRCEAEAGLTEVKVDLSRRHRDEIQTLSKKHREELEAMLSQLSDSARLEDELGQARKHITKLEGEISQLKDSLTTAKSQQINTEAKLLETRNELEAYQRDFQDKVRQTEERYRNKMDSLMHENALLRRRLLERTEQYCSYRSSVERNQSQILRDFKDRVKIVVQARSAAKLGVALGVEVSTCSSDGRPLSAPTTKEEGRKARMAARESGGVPPVNRPHSWHPRRQ